MTADGSLAANSGVGSGRKAPSTTRIFPGCSGLNWRYVPVASRRLPRLKPSTIEPSRSCTPSPSGSQQWISPPASTRPTRMAPSSREAAPSVYAVPGGAVELARRIEDLIVGKPGAFGVYARNLATNETVAVNADVVRPAESSVKTCILVHYADLVRTGALDPTARV